MENFRPLYSEHSDFLPEEPLGESVLQDDAFPVRVWVPKSPVIVLGRSQKAHKEIFLEATRRDSIPVFKRMGGGGCVMLDPGCVCVAIRYPRSKKLGVVDYLTHSSKAVQAFLYQEHGLVSELRENYDLSHKEKKFLGASLYMPKDWSVYYCVILVRNSSMEGISKYLSKPSKEPKYRAERTHADFLKPLENHIEIEDLQEFADDLQTFIYEQDWYLGPKPSPVGQ